MRSTRHTLAFVLVTIFLDSMGFGLIMPVLPRLMMRVGSLPLDRAIAVGAWMSLAMATLQFLSAPVLGNLSDAFGRRLVLLLALAGMAASYTLLSVADSVAVIFIGRALTGLFGGSYAPAQAAIADVTSPERRARDFALVGAAFGVGFIAGPALGGLLSQWGPRAPFWMALALASANLIYGVTLFPETLPAERRRRFDITRANPFGALLALRSTPGMVRLAGVFLLWQVAASVYPLTWNFWAIAALGWSDKMIGLSLAGVGVVIALTQATLTGPTVKRLGERNAATLGILGATAGFVGYALCHSTWLAFALLATVAMQSFVQPSLLAILSRHASAETQGEVQGVAAMSNGVGAIVGPVVLVAPLAWATGPHAPVHFAGIAYVIAAAIALAALALLRTVRLAPAAA